MFRKFRRFREFSILASSYVVYTYTLDNELELLVGERFRGIRIPAGNVSVRLIISLLMWSSWDVSGFSRFSGFRILGW